VAAGMPSIFLVTKKTLFLFLLCALAGWSVARADEETRQVQEELRKRHLFFREIDGRPSPEYALALKQYQQRQGFAQTGQADEMTLYSLGIGEPSSPAEGAGDLPDVPVLRSDAAVHEETRPKAPPAPTKTQNAGDVAKADIHNFLRRYFDACQSPNPDDELAFYAEKVEYFDHGVVDRPYIRNELAVYDQRWPSRKYTLGDSLRVSHVGNNTIAKIRVNFQVANPEHNRKAGGRTDNTFSLEKRGDSLAIVSIKEARVRKKWRHRRRPPNFPAAVGRSIQHVFRNIFH
ncbi:MAG TPA: peptidoglycan-binding domain-containing protein, partial [Chthoniobacterales bacterium]|nr:peptidoglycan-binding domain-containing protein [Chthoniobacterales bacterium]